MQTYPRISRGQTSALSTDDGDNITLQVSSRQSHEPPIKELNETSIDSGTELPGRTRNLRTNRPWGRKGKGAVYSDPSVKLVEDHDMMSTVSSGVCPITCSH